MYRDFRDLKIWQEGLELLLKIYKLTNEFPSEERYGLRSQLCRSANSIIANIAEGWGKRYTKEKIKTLSVAQGEISETMSHLIVSEKLGYVSSKICAELIDRYRGLSAGIQSYANSLANQIQKKK